MPPPSPPLFKDHPQHVASVVRAVLEAADPQECIRKHVAPLDTQRYSLLAAGKASAAMARGFVAACEATLSHSVVIGPPGTRLAMRGIVPDSASHAAYDADHPLPTVRNVEAAEAAAELARRGAGVADETLVVLLSGGASAFLALPQPPMTLEDLRDITQVLLRAGANIHELNAVRKHLEQLKGGGLAKLASPAPVRAFILSDVMDDDLATIASGPLVADHSTFASALEVLERCGRGHSVPRVTAHFKRGVAGLLRETLKAGDPALANVVCTIVGSNALALTAAAREVTRLGFGAAPIRENLSGDARGAGRQFAHDAQSHTPTPDQPCCIIAGGETIVHVRGQGAGGRNQEFALAAALQLDGSSREVVASFATDGVDGPTDAAGAYVSGETCTLASSRGLDAQAFLDDNDSHTFFSKVGTLIRTGPTGTNVNDIALALIYPK
ncbi:MAG: DUF4147 domain-containing protein [Pyrinomonadaceae bacterium]|nr:DUF4147 domain-containing protein [Phycisphaerales bacterium]